MLRVGLTGGIACGKSNALRAFALLGAHTIDADQLARAVVKPGKPALGTIVEEFGQEVLNPAGTLDRKKLANIVFRDDAARLRLNEIVHPHVIEAEEQEISKYLAAADPLATPVVVVDAPLMIEIGRHGLYDFIVVAYCPPAVQMQRLMARDQFTNEEALLRLRSQMSPLEKARMADFIIETSGKLSDTAAQVRYIFKEMLFLLESRTD